MGAFQSAVNQAINTAKQGVLINKVIKEQKGEAGGVNAAATATEQQSIQMQAKEKAERSMHDAIEARRDQMNRFQKNYTDASEGTPKDTRYTSQQLAQMVKELVGGNNGK